MGCEYCQRHEDYIIYESEYWIIYISEEQSLLGRSIIMLKRHAESLSGLSKEEWNDFIILVKKFEPLLKQLFGANMFNWSCLMNDAFKAKNPKPHVHWHVRPRYKKKVEFAGQIFEDPDFGHHYNKDRKIEVSKELRKKIIDKIKSGFNQP